MIDPRITRVFLCMTAAAVLVTHPGAASAQEDDALDPRPESHSPSPGFLGRFFSPSQPKTVSQPTPREPKSGGGFSLPMRSFSNPFRARSDQRDAIPAEENQGRRPPRPPREPFQEEGQDDDPNEPANEEVLDVNGAEVGSDEEDGSVQAVGTPKERDQGSPSRTSATATPARSASPSTTRRTLSGATLQASPRIEAQAQNNLPSAQTGAAGKLFEATPKTDSIDSKGTSRRKSQVVGDVPRTNVESKSKPALEPKPSLDLGTTSPKLPMPVATPVTATPETQATASQTHSQVVSAPRASGTAASPNRVPKTSVPPPSSVARDPSPKPRRAMFASRTTVLPSADGPALAAKTIANPNAKTSTGIDLESPGVRLNVTGPESILVGQDCPYEVLLTNERNAPVEGLTVRLSVPSAVEFRDLNASEGNFTIDANGPDGMVTWKIERLPADGAAALKMKLRTETAEHFAMNVDWQLPSRSADMAIQVEQPQLQLALEGPAEVDYGSPQIYRLRVRNPGNSVARDVVVELAAAPQGNNRSEVGDIPPGSERVVEVELTFQQTGRLPIRAKAVSQVHDLTSESNIEVDVRHALLVAQWNGPEEHYQGNAAEFVLTLENQGAIPAKDTACSIRLPSGVEIQQLPAGVIRSGEHLRWELSQLPAGEKREYAFQCMMNEMGENRLEFHADCGTGDPATTTFSTLVDAIADLHLSVNDPIAPAPVGQPVTYEITITNRGKKSAEDVYVIAQFSEGIEPTRFEGHTGKHIPGQVLFDAIPIIEPGQKVVLQVVAEASKPGVHRFRAAVRCQGTEDDILKEESTRFAAGSSSKGNREVPR